MYCKHCNAELGEDSKFCSSCGKPVNEPEQESVIVEDRTAEESVQGPEIIENKKSGGKIALAVVAVVVVLAVLVAVVIGGLGGEELLTGNDATIAPTAGMVEETTEATEGTIPADGNPDDATCKGSYTATAEEVTAAADTVVATMGQKELTVEELQIFYWTEFAYFMQDYGSYASYLGLDYTQPLDTQICTLVDETMTWQQYFLGCALDSWRSYQAMSLETEANGLEISDELRQSLDNLPAELDASAETYGLANGEELLKNNFGPGATLEAYVNFWETYYTGYAYYNDQYAKLLPTAEEVEAYFNENAATYEENGITADGGKYVDVRHILLMPEGGTTDEETGTTTYSEEEWEACRQAAQEVYDLYLAGDMSEDSFAALANEHSEDGGSNANGGLYENVYVGQMVKPFEDWCFDEARQVGDHGLVRTDYGYHIMYFVGSQDIWFATAEDDLINERATALVPAAMEKHPAQIDYSAIVLGLVDLN